MKNFWGAAWAKKFWPSKEYLTTAKSDTPVFLEIYCFDRGGSYSDIDSLFNTHSWAVHWRRLSPAAGYLYDIICMSYAGYYYLWDHKKCYCNGTPAEERLRRCRGWSDIGKACAHIRGSRPHTNYYKVLCAWRRNGRTKGISRRCTAVPFLSPGSPLRFPPVMALAFLKALWYNEKR